MEEGISQGSVPIILGRSFMKTARSKIDVYAGTLSMEFGDIVVHFNILDVASLATCSSGTAVSIRVNKCCCLDESM